MTDTLNAYGRICRTHDGVQGRGSCAEVRQFMGWRWKEESRDRGGGRTLTSITYGQNLRPS